MGEKVSIYNEHERLLEEERLRKVMALASLMHENWRKNRLDPDSKTYIPRIKMTKDEKWISEHGGATEVDIANTPFDELPADWQEENCVSAREALEKMEDALYLIHDKWLDRNESQATDEEKVQYSRLPKAEQLKDVEILEQAVSIIKDGLR